MLKLEISKMQKAIQRAKAEHLKVKVLNVTERIYSVTGSKGDVYTVRFVIANGHKLGECNCKGGQAGLYCKHLVSAAAVNMGLRGGYSQDAYPADGLSVVDMLKFERCEAPYGHGYLI